MHYPQLEHCPIEAGGLLVDDDLRLVRQPAAVSMAASTAIQRWYFSCIVDLDISVGSGNSPRPFACRAKRMLPIRWPRMQRDYCVPATVTNPTSRTEAAISK